MAPGSNLLQMTRAFSLENMVTSFYLKILVSIL